MKTKSNLLRNILVFFNLGVVICYLIACLLPFIDTGEYWILALPGLVFPFIFFLLVSCIVTLFILKLKWYRVSLIALLLGFQQMIAAYAAEWAGVLGPRLGCVTPDEAVASHELWAAAILSHQERKVVHLPTQP